MIVETGNHYLLQVKANQKHLLQEIKEQFDESIGNYCTKIEKNRGRIELRTSQVLPFNNSSHPHIKSIIKLTTKVSSKVSTKTTKLENTTKSHHYFIFNLTETPEFFLKTKRNHWSIEAFHYKKDATLKEDNTRTKTSSIDSLINSLICNLFPNQNLAKTLRQLANQPLLAYQT